MESEGGCATVNNIENNENEILSFEELRKKLGMDEVPVEKQLFSNKPSENNEVIIENDITSEIEKQLEEQVKTTSNEPKTLVENGKTFVDVTEQYVKEPVVLTTTETPIVKEEKKKKRRTFNQIFSDFFSSIIPQKKDSNKEKIRKIIMDLSIIIIVGCIFAFGEIYNQNREQLQMEEEIKGQIIDTDNLDDNQYNEAWQEVFAQYPQIQFPENMNLRYSYLYALNQDLVGWLNIPGTNLDVQVVQGKDNDYYLRRDFYGKSSRYGCPYMDYKNDPKYLDDNTIIYGHHMTDGLIFSNLDKYKTLEGYKESPIIVYNTLYDTYYFKVFAAFYINATPADDNNYFFNFMITDFSTDERFSKFVDELEKRSVIDTGISVQPDDKLLTLVTCTYEFNDARFVVVGRMVRENEEPTVDTSKATLNTSPKFPQAWYDAKGLTNPYKDDKKWDE